jgi:hypothetical protein
MLDDLVMEVIHERSQQKSRLGDRSPQRKQAPGHSARSCRPNIS